VNPLVKYTLGRAGLFLAALLVLLPIPQLGIMVKLLVAVVLSFALSWFLLRGWQDELSRYLAVRAEERRAEKERLRATLAGEDSTSDRPTERDDRPPG
jgi:Protein of unknown function (DUF4229)